MTKPTSYDFSDRERGYFERLQQTFNTGVASGIQMILAQQGLEGQWRIKLDGLGIERVDAPSVMADSEFQEVLKQANGVA